MRNVINCHPSWGSSRYCSPSWVPGPNMTTDPRGEPLLPDQTPFSARRRSIATCGGIIINPPDVFSARHPGCINGNESHSSSGIVLLHDPTSHRRNIPRRSSLVGRFAVAAAVAVAGAVPPGKSASFVLIPSTLERRWTILCFRHHSLQQLFHCRHLRRRGRRFHGCD